MSRLARRLGVWLLVIGGLPLLGGHAWGECRGLHVARAPRPRIQLAAASNAPVTIQWFGHNFFQLTSSRGTRVLTDPYGPGSFPLPDVVPHVITVGREHIHHNFVAIARNAPIVLRGLTLGGADWNPVSRAVRDVMIYSVPVFQGGWIEGQRKGSAFVFEMDELCIAHLGDLAHPLTKQQLDVIGRVDVALVPIDGTYTMGPETAQKVLGQLTPRIVIPMHYWDNDALLGRFLAGLPRVRRLPTDTITVTKATLPAPTEIVVLTHHP